MSDLETTVRQFQSGNRSAFENLVKRYQDFVISVAYSLIGDFGRSEDVAQQAFVVAWQKQDELKDVSRFGGWLRSITRNLARNEKRKTGRHQVADDAHADSFDIPDRQPSPLEHTITNEQTQWLWEVLKQIPEIYREPLVLYYRHDHSISQIAVMLEITEDTAKQRLSRGRKALREEVAATVEKSLAGQKSNPSFALGVLVAISASGAGKAGGSIVTTGIGAAATTWSLPAIVGSLGGLFGAGIGVGGAVYGSRKSLESATSQQERKFIWKMIVWTTILVGLITFWQLAGAFWFPELVRHPLLQGAVWSVYAIVLVTMITWGNRRIQQIKKRHGTPQEKTQTNSHMGKPISYFGLCSNLAGTAFGCWLWLILLAGISHAWLLMAAAIAFFLTTTATVCVIAKARTGLIEQMKLTAHFALVTTVLVALTVLIGWSSIQQKAELFANRFISVWLIALFILLMGIAISQLIFWRIRNLIASDDLPSQ